MFKTKKFWMIFILTCLVMEIIALIPTFSKLISSNSNTIVEWDKTVANSFHSGTGTIDDPYIITDAKELAFFASELENNSFKDKYIKLDNDILINKGFFKYNNSALYIEDDNEYYFDPNTSSYYLESTFETKKGDITKFMNLNGFEGTFDGSFHTIYGLYLNGDNEALFTNLSGNVENLFIENAFVYGNYESAGVVLDATNATIKNIIFNGNVIGNKMIQENNLTNTIDDIEVNGEYKLDLKLPLVTSTNYTFTLKGTCTSDISNFTINGNQVECSDFNLELDPYEININSTSNIVLTNLEYTLTYTTNLSSGIISRANNSILEGLVNKGTVVNTNTTGIVGISYNSNISNSYNTGKLIGDKNSSIIDTVLKSNITLTNVYSNNNHAFIDKAISSNITFINSFNTNTVKAINNNTGSYLTVNSSYNIEEIPLTYNINNVRPLFKDYNQDKIDEGNIWINNDLPLLYFDEINNRCVNIKINNYNWDSYNSNLNDIDFDDEISIMLTAKNDYKPIKEAYYYISNSSLSIDNLNSLEWTNTYNGVITLSEKSSYIVYVKVVDYNDNIYYLNTDRLNLAIENFYASINSNDLLWEEFKEINNLYVDHNLTYTVTAIDKKNGIESIKYLISETAYTKEELDSIEEWNPYVEELAIDLNNYILYVKVTTNDLKTIYLNTDRIINKGYQVSNLKSGNNLVFNNNMTYNSEFNFNISLSHDFIDLTGYKRYLKTNTNLPVNTLILLKDLDSNKVYEYITTSKDTNSYSLDNFIEIGKKTFISNFDNSNYDSKELENFNISFSFNDISKVDTNLEISMIATKDKTIINTYNPITINLYDVDTNINNYLNLSSNFIDSITYNTENTISIPINISLNNVIKDEVNILNTNYENMHQVLSIEVVDSNNNIIDSSLYKGIKFSLNDTIYTPSDNKTLIDLGTNYNQDIILDIISSIDTNSNISDTYYFKINTYLSLDGIVKLYESKNNVSIPLVYNVDYTKLDYSFNVSIPDGLIYNKNNNRTINFNIEESGLNNPNVRVSLYKKKLLTAYNQEYVLVDLNKYIENKLRYSDVNTYYVNDINSFSVIIKDDIESNGYMFNFKLYDGENYVGEVNLKTIVR